MTTPYRLPLTPLQSRLLRASQRYGTTPVIAAITGFSVFVSVAITWLSLLGIPADHVFTVTALALATFIPLLVAPLASSAVVQLAHVVADAHARLQVQASTDSLTGIANRRRFFELAPALLANAGDSALVGMVDLDHFKQINDRHGHSIGDTALVALARRLQHAAGVHGLVARIGGDEFALLIPVDEDSRRIVEDALRHACRDIEIQPGLVVNASIGLEAVAPVTPLDEAMARADNALYNAKAVHRRPEGTVHILRATVR